MHPALGAVTEGLLTQIASHTFRGYVSALGSPERARGDQSRPPVAKRCRIERERALRAPGPMLGARIRSALPMSLAVALELSWCARLGIEPRTS